MVWRSRDTFEQCSQLADEIAHAVRAFSCVLDGEVCCLDADGRMKFRKFCSAASQQLPMPSAEDHTRGQNAAAKIHVALSEPNAQRCRPSRRVWAVAQVGQYVVLAVAALTAFPRR